MLTVHIVKKFSAFTLQVDFEAENTVLALLGASGCGKSMTLRCVAGIVKPDRGRIVLDGRVLFDADRGINLPPQKRRAGLLFQNYALFPNMTVEGNIFAGLRAAGNRDGKKARAAELLAAFHLEGHENKYPGELSGGQQQRAALARLLAGEPRLIMLDEPLSALDSYLRWQLEEELLSVIEKFSGTVLYVSHNRDEVYRLCKKVCVLCDGASDPVVTVEELFTRPRTRAAALLSGCKNFSRARRLSDTRLLAVDWDWELECRPLSFEPAYVGVRAHYISRAEGRNRAPRRVARIIPDVFSTIVTLDPPGGPRPEGSLRMETAGAEGLRPGDLIEVGIAPESILPLADGGLLPAPRW